MLESIGKYIYLLRKTFLTDFAKIHYSQFGEDIVLRELIRKNVRNGFYVDVGCYHPKKFSNTHMLHKKGWGGINIDLEEDKIKCFELARPRDYNIVAAVSDRIELVKLFRFRKFGLASTIVEEVASSSEEKLYEISEIQTQTLNEIIEKSPYKGRQIDLLSIDTEGHDMKVLQSLDLDTYRPKIIIIESHHAHVDEILNGEIYVLLRPKGYVLSSWVYRSLIFSLPGSDILRD